MTHVVLIIGAAASTSVGGTLSGESSVLESLLTDTSAAAELSIVSLGFDRPVAGLTGNVVVGGGTDPLFDRMLSALGVRALYTRLSRRPIGRLINSMGPLDQGRVLWRRVRRSTAAITALKNADLVIASDLAGVKTAWLATKRGWSARAIYDTRAAGVGVNFAVSDSN